ncbi:hypothetical protein L210DRAFT_3651902 [Boletus edulis BED1]|uniref:Uncharacterized protein n=1 Tax=Boletus edulis BED1 TaxID=1328754 RepID=A0AAD4BH28_BOLED|nr:hypothetical protein L210DRAFT_3651902 [Boletus edulis BED1]
MARATQRRSKTPIIAPPIFPNPDLPPADALVTALAHATRRRSKTPGFPVTEAPATLPVVNEDLVGEQIGGGRRRQITPPPMETPTKLRPRIKRTKHATGMIQQAEHHRAQLTRPDPIPPSCDIALDLDPADVTPTDVVANGSLNDAARAAPPIPAQSEPEPFTPHSPSPSHTVPENYHDNYIPPLPPSPAVPENAAGDSVIDPVLLAESQSMQPTCYHGGCASPASSLPATQPSLTATHHHADASSTQPSLPVTRVIPPTPHAGKHTQEDSTDQDSADQAIVLHTEEGDEMQAGPDGGDVPSTPTSGRRSARVTALLNEGCEELERVLMNVMAQTSLTARQIMDGWHKSRGRSINGTNHWNLYARYLAKNEEQERRRLGLPTDAPITPQTRGQLYTRFKEDNHEWQEILEVHEMLDLADSAQQTLAQRANSFNKLRRKVTNLLEMASAKHGFESAVVMCGNTVNQDTSLGFTHESPGAKNFFKVRCRADENTVMGHLKAHVYNEVSLELVNEEFPDGNNEQIEARDAQAPHGEGTVAKPSLSPVPETDTVIIVNDDMLPFIKASLTTLIVCAGGDVSKFKPGNFPWTSVPAILASQSLVMRGWPASVSMPGDRGGTSKAKGITILKKAERLALCSALESKEITIEKVHEPIEKRALAYGESPVIIGAPPPADSRQERAQRIFSNLAIDFNGPERLPPSIAGTRIKRKLKKSERCGTVDEPIELSSGDDKGKPKSKPVARDHNTIDISSGDESPTHIRKVKDPKAAAGIKRVARQVNVVELPDGSLMLADEEEYLDPDPSGKRKAADQGASSLLAKKPMHARANAGKKNGKGKARALFSDSSDSEDDNGSEITVKGPQVASSSHSDPFMAPPGAQMPRLLQTPSHQNIQGALDSLVPSSPSPKRLVHTQSHSSSTAPPMVPESAASSANLNAHLAAPRAPSAPAAGPCSADKTLPVPRVSSAPISPSSGSADNTLTVTPVPPVHSNGALAALSGAAPQHAQPTLLAPSIAPQAPGIANGYRPEHGEWADPRRQQLGGGYRYYGPYPPYMGYVGDGATFPPQHYPEVPHGVYTDPPIYRDARGVYGGFHPYGNFTDPAHVFAAPGPSRTHHSPPLADVPRASAEP